MYWPKAMVAPKSVGPESVLHEGLCGMLMGTSKTRRAGGDLCAEGLLIRTAMRHSPRELYFVISKTFAYFLS